MERIKSKIGINEATLANNTDITTNDVVEDDEVDDDDEAEEEGKIISLTTYEKWKPDPNDVPLQAPSSIMQRSEEKSLHKYASPHRFTFGYDKSGYSLKWRKKPAESQILDMELLYSLEHANSMMSQGDESYTGDDISITSSKLTFLESEIRVEQFDSKFEDMTEEFKEELINQGARMPIKQKKKRTAPNIPIEEQKNEIPSPLKSIISLNYQKRAYLRAKHAKETDPKDNKACKQPWLGRVRNRLAISLANYDCPCADAIVEPEEDVAEEHTNDYDLPTSSNSKHVNFNSNLTYHPALSKSFYVKNNQLLLKGLRKFLPSPSYSGFKYKVKRRIDITPSYVEEVNAPKPQFQIVTAKKFNMGDAKSVTVLWERKPKKCEEEEEDEEEEGEEKEPMCHQKEFVILMEKISLYRDMYIQNRAIEIKMERRIGKINNEAVTYNRDIIITPSSSASETDLDSSAL